MSLSHLRQTCRTTGLTLRGVYPAVWRTITVGTFDSGSAYLRAIESANCRVEDGIASAVIQDAVPVRPQRRIDLVNVSVAELGFPLGGSYRQIRRRAGALGFRLCSPEIGAALRLAYTDQPMGDSLIVAMAPIPDSKVGFRRLLALRRCDGPWASLETAWGDEYVFWHREDRFLFVAATRH